MLILPMPENNIRRASEFVETAPSPRVTPFRVEHLVRAAFVAEVNANYSNYGLG
jgi:hypothetical protein